MVCDESPRKDSWMCILPCCGCGLFLLVILMPMSFAKLHFYEAGILARSSTGTVYENEVYG